LRRAAQRAADERQKVADQHLAAEEARKERRRQLVEQQEFMAKLRTLTTNERVSTLPVHRLRKYLAERGVPRQTLLCANWFWLRAEAIRCNVDLEPLCAAVDAETSVRGKRRWIKAKQEAERAEIEAMARQQEVAIREEVHIALDTLRKHATGAEGMAAIANLFKQLDPSGDNNISMDELAGGLKDIFHLEMSKAASALVMKEFDADGDGEIDYFEFVQHMRRLAKTAQDEVQLVA